MFVTCSIGEFKREKYEPKVCQMLTILKGTRNATNFIIG